MGPVRPVKQAFESYGRLKHEVKSGASKRCQYRCGL